MVKKKGRFASLTYEATGPQGWLSHSARRQNTPEILTLANETHAFNNRLRRSPLRSDASWVRLHIVFLQNVWPVASVFSLNHKQRVFKFPSLEKLCL